MTHFFLDLKSAGEAFKKERLAVGMTQAQVAEKAGVRRETIIQLESGAPTSSSTIIQAVAAIGKALAIVDRRLDYDNLDRVFDED
ncbi:MAG: helix-turn-helix transcriptional regulator [Acidiferrobacterales bacterium]